MSGVQAVLFDWGGTLTPWHAVDLLGQWSGHDVEPDATIDRLADLLPVIES